MVAISGDEPGIDADFEEPDPELIRKHGHYHLDPESHAEYRIPAEPAGRHLIVRRIKNEQGALETRLDWAPWWDNIPAEKRALVLKARAEQDEEKLRDILAQLGITDLQNPEHLRQAVMLGLRDRVAGWIDEPPEIQGPPKPPPAAPKPGTKPTPKPTPASKPAPPPSPKPKQKPKPRPKPSAPVGKMLDSVEFWSEKPEFLEAIEAIDAVHRVPKRFGKVSVGTLSPAHSAEGSYQSLTQVVQVKMGTNRERNTLIHELGHWLDNMASGSALDFASQQSGALAAWRKAVRSSNALKKLGEVGARHPQHARYFAYLQSDEEVWARAYTQYIATRSGNAKLLAGIAEEQSGQLAQHTYWSKADFEPIAKAMDSYFEELGWLKKP